MLIYLLKVNFIILVFTAAYWLLLRKGGLLQLNRLILVIGIGLAFLLPALPPSQFLGDNVPEPVRELTSRAAAALPEIVLLASPPLSETRELTVSETSPLPAENWWWQPVLWIFLTVAAFMLFLLLRQFVHIFKLILYSANAREDGLTIVHTDEDIPPFSFFRFLVINPAKYGQEELRRIIVHEKAHIRQHHYLDILVGEMLRVVCWFNPAAWVLNGLLKMNLEYIADRQVLSAGIDRKNYQFQLLQMSVRGQSLRLTTPLNYSPIKMRVTMMNTKKTNALSPLRYALLLPIFLLSVMVINPTQAQESRVLTGAATASSSTELASVEGTALAATSTQIASSVSSTTAGRDIYFVIRPTTSRKTLMDVQETLAEYGIAVKYDKLRYKNDLLMDISVSIRSDNYSGNLSYSPLNNRLVFYDLQVDSQITGFESGTPRKFKLKQRDMIDELSGLLIHKSNGRVTIRGSARID